MLLQTHPSRHGVAVSCCSNRLRSRLPPLRLGVARESVCVDGGNSAPGIFGRDSERWQRRRGQRAVGAVRRAWRVDLASAASWPPVLDKHSHLHAGAAAAVNGDGDNDGGTGVLEELASAGRLNGRGRGRAPTYPRAFLQLSPKKDCTQLRRRTAPDPEERTAQCSWRKGWHEGPSSSLVISRG